MKLAKTFPHAANANTASVLLDPRKLLG